MINERDRERKSGSSIFIQLLLFSKILLLIFCLYYKDKRLKNRIRNKRIEERDKFLNT